MTTTSITTKRTKIVKNVQKKNGLLVCMWEDGVLGVSVWFVTS